MAIAGPKCVERHAAWAGPVPDSAEARRDFVVSLHGGIRAAPLAHCAGLSLNAVCGFERHPLALAYAGLLAASTWASGALSARRAGHAEGDRRMSRCKQARWAAGLARTRGD